MNHQNHEDEQKVSFVALERQNYFLQQLVLVSIKLNLNKRIIENDLSVKFLVK